MRLKIFTQYYPPDYAATGQLIEELVDHLGGDEIQVEVFTSQPSYAFDNTRAPVREKTSSAFVHRSRSTRFWPRRIRGKAIEACVFTIRTFLNLIRSRWHLDVLLLTTAPPFLPWIGYIGNILFGLPYICLMYDLYPDIIIELNVISSENILVKFWNALNCLTWLRAKSVIVLSSTMRDRVIERCPGIASKVHVIHSWADPLKIVPIPKTENWFAHKYDLVNYFTVLYSGNMGRCHDLETILEAAKYLQEYPVRFVFIGNGAKHQVLVEVIEDWNLKNCLLLPYQESDTLPFSLTACDLSLVSISAGMEGLVVPSKLYSALAAGRPVAAICESHSYLNSLIEEAHCGKTFLNGDSQLLSYFIIELMKNPELVVSLGRSGRQYMLHNFTPDVISRHYAKVITGRSSSLTKYQSRSCLLFKSIRY
ncbi:glycosyltransferase [Synechococcales cyanobacterium C]|uniref:Glycosyltransferase n=1 Tax=Petrachloros mirabilis ULC683 TaxID=2781853 RepID=A0A8K2A960_9CYAN|nr:glycosyltransferase family 4 protein [Petrachloros mirabilis]NCJ07640.1 glycosyltransferase [Petrachloros mirabilis ULC683]